MMHHPFKIMALSLLSAISFSACSYLPTTSPSPIKQLEQVQNIEALPNTKANVATLSQSKNDCLIQFTGYFDAGESTETWRFKANQLRHAFSETYQYDLNRAIDVATQRHKLDQKTRTVTVFDIQSDETKHNFEKLKSHFSQTALAQCHSI